MRPPNGAANTRCLASPPDVTPEPPLEAPVNIRTPSRTRPVASITSALPRIPRRKSEPLVRNANQSLRVGTNFAGKGFARARDRPVSCPRDHPSPDAETGKTAFILAKRAGRIGFFQRPQETLFSQEWLVADALNIEPVSTIKFPDNRENTGNFFDFGPNCTILASNLPAPSMACSQIPYSMELGIFLA
jgi:hypothetical protein